MTHSEKAMALFREGYNCSQSVFLAFEDMYDMDHSMAVRLSSAFGAGMGKLREVCGCMTGAFMAAGILFGYEDITDIDEKKRTYGMIQEIAKKFEEEKGTIICRELLGLKKGEDLEEPAVRTEEYYTSRPCMALCGLATQILDDYISCVLPKNEI